MQEKNYLLVQNNSPPEGSFSCVSNFGGLFGLKKKFEITFPNGFRKWMGTDAPFKQFFPFLTFVWVNWDRKQAAKKKKNE